MVEDVGDDDVDGGGDGLGVLGGVFTWKGEEAYHDERPNQLGGRIPFDGSDFAEKVTHHSDNGDEGGELAGSHDGKGQALEFGCLEPHCSGDLERRAGLGGCLKREPCLRKRRCRRRREGGRGSYGGQRVTLLV